MTNKADATNVSGLAGAAETAVSVVEQTESAKKSFVEPELTVPVDILEATTFFQSLTSGSTLP